MGKNSDLKQIRGQLRQLVKEILPEVFTTELVKALEKQLSNQLKSGLDKIDDRQKELQSYIIRNVNIPTTSKAEKK